MKKLGSIIIIVGVLLSITVSMASAQGEFQRQSEVRYWDAANSYNGYTLFASAGTTYLVDMEGYVVNTWPIGTNPRLLDNGHLLDAATDDPSGFNGFQELDWDGNVVWEYYETREDYHPHHDFVRIYNAELGDYTMLYIANKDITHEECIAAGCDPVNGPYDEAQMDVIVEVDMAGNVVWEWRFFDHVVQDIDPTKLNYVGEGYTVADYPGRINLNLPGMPVKRDWLHCNSLDYNEALDQIVINSVHGEFYIIDHGGTFTPDDAEGSLALAAGSAGDFLYRFGDPARYEQGDPPAILEDWTASTTGTKQIGGSHDIQWIKPGLPGEGHFLIFNNGQYLFERTPQSYIFEINGFLDAAGNETGSYINPPDAGYYSWRTENSRDTHKQVKQMSNQIVWIYSSKNNTAFFSHIGSGAQRLPNGNTLITAMTEGHIFEVTTQGEVVWEYINPLTREGALEILPESYPMTNATFRAYRYSAEHPALIGRDLTPQGTITGRTPSYLSLEGLITGESVASSIDAMEVHSVTCLSNTTGEAECKDCCDCLMDVDGETRKNCRDQCPTHDFSLNTDFITVDAPSTLGSTGDYSTCTGAGNEQSCKACCDASMEYMCGDFRFCRDACAQLP
jgi:hypothetical protein